MNIVQSRGKIQLSLLAIAYIKSMDKKYGRQRNEQQQFH